MEDLPLSELQKFYNNQYVSHSDLQDFVAKYHLATPTKSQIIKHRLKYLLTFQFSKRKQNKKTINRDISVHCLNSSEDFWTIMLSFE